MTNIERLARRLNGLEGDNTSLLTLVDMACTLVKHQEQEEGKTINDSQEKEATA